MLLTKSPNCMIKKLLFLLLPAFFYAQIPTYYSGIDFTQTGENLKSQLATLITNTHTTKLPYTSSSLDTWDVIQQTDLENGSTTKLYMVYGYNDFDAATNNDRTRAKNLMGTSSCIGFWNREHTFPQSLANPPMDTGIPGVSTDIHHLRAADCQLNSTRGNKIFADGQGDAISMGSTTWYPGDEWKGDVARMMMYLYVRYGNVTPANTIGSGSSAYSPLNDMRNIFLEWNVEDPVSLVEMNRNNILEGIQGNRNPFIDNPYLATVIWGGPQAPDTWNTLTCTNTTTWNGSTWSNGVPNKSVLAVFNSNFTLTSDLEMCSLNIASGVNVEVPSGINLTVVRGIVVNSSGTLIIRNNANLIQINDVANTGNIVVYKDSAPLVRLDYTSWSSPVSGQNLKVFSPNTLNNRFYEYNPAGTTTATAYNAIDPLTNNFLPTKGYIIRAPNNWSTTATVFNGQFIGIPNNGKYTSSLQTGYNMLGNPYPSTITANEFIANNRTIETLYFWTHTAPASGGSYPVNNFASYTTMGGVASAAGGLVPDGTIKPGQGFYVYSSENEQVLFHNGQRIKTSNNQFFRNQEISENIERHRIWLNLESATNSYNQILVGYSNAGTYGFDLAFDGKTMDTEITHLYSTIEQNGDYVIQARPLPFETSDKVNLGIKVNDAGSYKISIERKDGLFDNMQNIYLKDNFTGILHNFNSGYYQFNSEIGNFKNRFELVYQKENNEIIDENTIVVYNTNNNLIVSSSIHEIKHIIVFDILGRTLLAEMNVNANEFELKHFSSDSQPLLMKIVLNNGKVVFKKVIF